MSLDRHAEGPERDDVVRLDSRQLRCLAHPLRARLLSALRMGGPATASHLAERLDTNSGATSYHLRQLGEVGLVEDADDLGAGRERYWRAAHTFTSWTPADFEEDPEDREAMTWLLGHNDRLKSTWRGAWLEARHEYPQAWRDAATPTDIVLRATPSQLRALLDELTEVVHRYRDAGPDEPSVDGVEATDVAILIEGFPFREAAP